MVIVKESRKEFDNLFEDEKAILDFEEKYGGINLCMRKLYKKTDNDLFLNLFYFIGGQ